MDAAESMKSRPFIIHPCFFALYPVIFLYARNLHEVTFSQIIVPLSIMAFLVAIVSGAVGLVAQSPYKGAAITSLFFLIFFSYGPVRDLLAGKFLGIFHLGRPRHIMVVMLGFLVAGTVAALLTKRKLDNLTAFLNILSLCLIVFPLFQALTFEVKKHFIWSQPLLHEIQTPVPEPKSESRPDIYYIILDAYASSSVFQNFYDFSNEEFENELIQRGFYIARDSRCNYIHTILSLPSSLNMEYIHHSLNDAAKVRSNDHAILYLKQITEDNKVWKFLKSKGYKFVHITSGGSPPNDYNRFADFNYRGGTYGDFTTLLLQSTFLSHFLQNFIDHYNREKVLYALEKLSERPKSDAPIFFFAHVNSPHPPFVFGPNGETIPRSHAMGFGNQESLKKTLYRDQVIFLNKKVLTLLDSIMSKRKISPIIILQSDHGPFSTIDWGDEWNSEPQDDALRERVPILNAYYLPNGGEKVLSPDVSPINSFRLIFNYYFNADFPILPDEHYYSSYDKLYELSPITDRVRK